MAEGEWKKGLRALGIRLSGEAIEEMDQWGKAIIDDSFLMLINAHHEQVLFTLPAHRKEVRWEAMLDTRGPLNPTHLNSYKGGQKYNVGPRTLALLRLGSTLKNSG